MTTIIHNVQQRTPEWADLRLGKMTGSRLRNIIDCRTMMLKKRDVLKTAAFRMLAESMTGFSADSDYMSPSMFWGIEQEQEVKQLYNNGNGKDIGFATNDRYKYLGCSPDMLLGVTTGIEIKCPNSETHVRYLLDGGIPSEYLPQVLNYFLIFDDLDEMLFVSYDPRNRVKEIYEHRITRKESDDKLKSLEQSMFEFESFYDDLQRRVNVQT